MSLCHGLSGNLFSVLLSLQENEARRLRAIQKRKEEEAKIKEKEENIKKLMTQYEELLAQKEQLNQRKLLAKLHQESTEKMPGKVVILLV